MEEITISIKYLILLIISYLVYYVIIKYNKDITIIAQKNTLNNMIWQKLSKNIKSFKPTIFLPNFISIAIFYLFFKKINIKYEDLIIKTRDNAEIILNLYFKGFNNKYPLIILKSGIESDSNIIYVKKFCKTMENNNFNVIIMNNRTIKYSKSSKILSQNDINDIEDCLKFITNKYPNTNLFLCGISQGANYFTKFLGETKYYYNIKAAFMIANAFDLHNLIFHLNKTIVGSLCSSFILNGLKSKVKNEYTYNTTFQKFLKSQNFSLKKISKIKTILEFDDKISSKISGFKNIYEYYRNKSSKYNIQSIKIPILFLNSLEDEICKKEHIPIDHIYFNKNCILLLTERGGHIEFFSGLNVNWWGFQTAADYFKIFN